MIKEVSTFFLYVKIKKRTTPNNIIMAPKGNASRRSKASIIRPAKRAPSIIPMLCAIVIRPMTDPMALVVFPFNIASAMSADTDMPPPNPKKTFAKNRLLKLLAHTNE